MRFRHVCCEVVSGGNSELLAPNGEVGSIDEPIAIRIAIGACRLRGSRPALPTEEIGPIDVAIAIDMHVDRFNLLAFGLSLASDCFSARLRVKRLRKIQRPRPTFLALCKHNQLPCTL